MDLYGVRLVLERPTAWKDPGDNVQREGVTIQRSFKRGYKRVSSSEYILAATFKSVPQVPRDTRQAGRFNSALVSDLYLARSHCQLE